MRRFYRILFGLAWLWVWMGIQAQAADLKNNPNVKWASDGKAFTTDAGEKDYIAYPKGTAVSTGASGSLRKLQAGEHYYTTEKTGNIPIKKWEVKYTPGRCIHNSYGIDSGWHGVSFQKKCCGGRYKSGWIGVCADCGEEIELLFYMDKETAGSISYLPAGIDYYYLCPICHNLEQGRGIAHDCKQISWNRYTVKYEKNNPKASGYMEDSVFYYNNAFVYEGKAVNGAKKLRKNTFTCIGSLFNGWNTKADGTGIPYKDEQAVLNLTEENKGVIVLYAQWKVCRSTLLVNPAGGTYQGEKKPVAIKQEYGTSYRPQESLLTAPAGYTVSFDCQGGKSVADVTANQSFQSWRLEEPLHGRFLEEVYYFYGENNITDTITATYCAGSVELPETTKKGWSFGGWYEDSACTRPAGMGGEQYTPLKDITLYAKWVQLVLTATPNYKANDKKGAVNLTWSQPDETAKTYLLYQSTDKKKYVQLKGVSADEEIPLLNQQFSYCGDAQKVEISSSGFYELKAAGAQGGDYEEHTGGKGGQVTARIYLEKGDVLTMKVGGQSRYNGGGKGSAYGNGGGATTIVSKKKGTLIVAGGGGGASPAGNGGAGGKETSVREDQSSNGENGYSGGGGGYAGGKAGEYITHSHAEACYREDAITCDVLAEGIGTYSGSTQNMHSADNKIDPETGDYRIGGHNNESGEGDCISVFSIRNLSVKDYSSLSFMVEMMAEGGNAGAMGEKSDDQYVRITDQKGRTLWYADRNDLEVIPDTASDQTEYSNRKKLYQKATSSVSFTETNVETTAVKQQIKFIGEVTLPEGTTTVRMESKLCTQNSKFHRQLHEWKSLVLKGTKKTKICPYTDGQVISAKPAYGGSSFVTSGAAESSRKSGTQTGDGSAEIKAISVGYQEKQKQNGVAAPDTQSPDQIAENTVSEAKMDDGQIKVSWTAPQDYGTVYYHKVESYSSETGEKLCTSNITRNELCTGVAGYYYLQNSKSGTALTAKNGQYTKNRYVTITPAAGKQYLHLAAVDGAGNLSGTIHIPCGLENVRIPWKPETEQIEINSASDGTEHGSICPAGEKKYYVKADGITPFFLSFTAQLQGEARTDYQINRMLLLALEGNREQQIIAEMPYGTVSADSQEISGESVNVCRTMPEPVGMTDFRGGRRFQKGKAVTYYQGLTLDSKWHGKQVEIVPCAGADYEKGVLYSERKEDRKHGLYLIGDAEAPVISGAEILENLTVLKREERDFALTLTATDTLSGVGLFEAVVQNREDYSEMRYTPQEDGCIRILLSEDSPLFSGDVKITIRARDKVGNETTKEYHITEFGLDAEVSRILEPHTPIFKGGESGLLRIQVWGYAERVEVEFPPEMTKLAPQLNHVFSYEEPQWCQNEELQFMVPLYTPANQNYQIIVRAYKGDSCIEEYPSLCTLPVREENVLDELRTRLR